MALAVPAAVLATMSIAATNASAATPTYHVTTDVSARTSATAAPGGYGIPAGAAFTAICQEVGQPVGPKGNTLYFWASYAGRQFYIPDTYTDSPHTAGQPPIAGIPMCGAAPATPVLQPTCNPQQVGSPCYVPPPPAPAPANTANAGKGTFKNSAIATEGLKSATAGYGKGYDKPGVKGGQCRDWVNGVVSRVSGGSMALGGEPNDYNAGFRRLRAYQVPNAAAAIPGDIVQQGTTETDSNLHTYIIVKNKGNGVFDVVDSNHMRDGYVHYYERSYTTGTIWRLGQP